MESALVTPLRANDAVIGVILAESKMKNHFTLEHARLFGLLADQITIAVVDANLLARFNATQALASLGNMTGNLAHRMNNIIGGIRILAGFLAGDLRAIDADLSQKAQQIESAATDALKVVEDYENMFRLTSEDVDLVDLVGSVVQETKKPGSVQIVARLPGSPLVIHLPRQPLLELVGELVRNAIKAVGTDGQIDVELQETERSVRLVVSDNGKGIPPNLQDRIFERGVSQRDTPIGGGFGLWWVKKFLRSWNGTIKAENRDEGGARITVSLPKGRFAADHAAEGDSYA
jgi:signal transduction histidine kinase